MSLLCTGSVWPFGLVTQTTILLEPAGNDTVPKMIVSVVLPLGEPGATKLPVQLNAVMVVPFSFQFTVILLSVLEPALPITTLTGVLVLAQYVPAGLMNATDLPSFAPAGKNSNAPIVGVADLGMPLMSAGTSAKTLVPVLISAEAAGVRLPVAGLVNCGAVLGEPTSCVG
ncbi:hypothetical protein D3C86_1267240 [compost metagenome]